MKRGWNGSTTSTLTPSGLMIVEALAKGPFSRTHGSRANCTPHGTIRWASLVPAAMMYAP